MTLYACKTNKKVAWPSFVLWLEIGDQVSMGNFLILDFDTF